MSRLKRVAFIGNSLPRHCGIATFTTDLQQAVAAAFPAVGTSIVAMTDGDRTYDYPETVGFEIGQENLADYVAVTIPFGQNCLSPHPTSRPSARSA